MSRGRSERGAVAILTAALAAVLLVIGALGVDLGNSMNRKKLTQNSADFAALAGANGLPRTDSTTTQLVADSLNKNQPVSDGTDGCNADAGRTITAAMLSDGKQYNGEVTYPSSNNVKVVAPAARIQYGLANIIGIDDTCVQSTATARIASSAIGMTPYYTTPACSSGQRTMRDNSGGLSIPFVVPPLAADNETNDAVLTSSATSPSPSEIPLATVGAPDGPSVTIRGDSPHMASAYIDQVGIFSSDLTPPRIATITAQTNTSITFTVPNSVASTQGVWWIRVHSRTGPTPPGGADEWSARSEALPLQVGDAVLSCDVGFGSGNFGSLDIPWGGGLDRDDLVKNISSGLRIPTTLNKYPTATLPGDDQCQNLTGSGSVISTDALGNPNTNCLLAATGLEATVAYDGYLGAGGKLLEDTSAACTALGRPVRSTLATGEKVNDDLLSCFLKKNTFTLSDAIGYSGTDSIFTQDIWKSPRLVMVPVLDHDPTDTDWMPIKSFVPGFICDQPSGASKLAPIPGSQTQNGLVTKNPGQLRAIRVFFFDMDALPSPPDGTKLQDFFGSGKRVITLAN